MQEQTQDRNAPPVTPADAVMFRATAVARLEGGKTLDAPPVSFEGDHTLIAEVNAFDGALPLLLIVAPARTAGQLSLVNRTPWPVLFTIIRDPSGAPGHLAANGEIEVAPGTTSETPCV